MSVTYEDASGVLHEVFSAPTAAVANINDTPTGGVSINDATPTQGETLTAVNFIQDNDGLASPGVHLHPAAARRRRMDRCRHRAQLHARGWRR